MPASIRVLPVLASFGQNSLGGKNCLEVRINSTQHHQQDAARLLRSKSGNTQRNC